MSIFESAFQDARFSMRQFRGSWAFTGTAITVLALGIASSVAIFAFVDAALIKPLPYRQPSRLVGVFGSIPLFAQSNLSIPDYLDFKKLNTVFSSLDVYQTDGDVLLDRNGVQVVRSARVSDGFFRTLGVAPVLGRDFFPGEDLTGAPKTVLLSYSAWQARYGGRRNVLGESVTLDGSSNVIIGVLPPDFYFPPAADPEFWTPLHPSGNCDLRRSCHGMYGVARLKDGVSARTALANVQAIARQLEMQYPDTNRDQGATISSLNDVVVGSVRPILLMLLAGAGLLLLIATVNVASLLLLRSESRRKEFAIRNSLGASPARILGQFVIEGLLLVGIGGIAGIALVSASMRVLTRLVPANIMARMPFWRDLGINPHVLAFAAAIALLAAAVFSLTPAANFSFAKMRAGLAEAERGSAGTTWRRLGSKLVIVELATAMVLLVGAALLGKSLSRLLQVNLGFEPERLVMLNITAPDAGYSGNQPVRAFARKVLDQVRSVPGVESAAIARRGVPLDGNGNTNWFRVIGRPWHGEHEEAPVRSVSPDYFATLGAKLSRGRYFREDEDWTKPRVAIINASAARKFFPGEDPIGKQIVYVSIGAPPIEIVGIIEDVREGALDQPMASVMYVPFLQDPQPNFTLVARTAQAAQSSLRLIEAAVRQIDPSIAAYRGSTMTEKIHDSQSAYLHRSSAWLVGGFAGIALVLSVVGLYGVVAYSVSRRRREIGIRMALGADRGAVHRLIMREAGRLIAIGVAAGLAASLFATNLIGALLFEVRSWDVATLGGVAAILATAALLASFLPASRAASVNPTEALRSE
ncbi:MAG TPA: ABC transporter permease [Bryobacteraceae bacterium]|nr:ABC transporter permease [Bryobacteraceae bacterium]